MLFVLILNMIVIPLDVAFFSISREPSLMALSIFSDIVYGIDLVFNFRTGNENYVKKHAQLLGRNFTTSDYIFVTSLDLLSAVGLWK